jgi:cysteinyl-tRNA synthetase
MSEKTLGLPFDIHSGGMDLTFPHHENEIAQSCSAHKKADDPKYFAKYWFHNGFVIVNGEKMSKSIGNIRLVHELNKNYHGEVLRLSLLSSHYRKPLDWTSERITNSQRSLFRFYQKLKIVKDIEINENQCDVPENIMEALCNDLNVPAVLAILAHMTNDISTETSLDKKKKFKKEIVAVGKLLGLLRENPDKWLGYGHSKNLKDETIDNLIKKRNEARRNKNYILADKIRDELKSKGIEIEDKKNETVWRSEK